MSNILNLLSEETFIEKMDRQNDLLEYLVKVQGGVGIIPNYTWEEIQRIVRLGIAPKIFELGGQLSVNRNGEELVFDIVSFDTAVPADTSRSHSMTLMMHNVLFENFEFNTIGSSDSPCYYDYSTIRQWLNSSESAGNWWSSINNNTAPSYANIDGFMKGIDNDFLRCVGKTRLKTTGNRIIDDYFYIPSAIEIGIGMNSNTSNIYYDYGTVFTGINNDKDLYIKYNKEGELANYWTRTFKRENSGSSYYYSMIYISGTTIKENGYHSNKYGICPVCNII